ncbi:MAG: branched-chain amino acid ABC transporter substrate-binding protein [Proteobacteria bacterium]|nr:MAG: branched-chain amino acid ABC transporter substrate-binding protein [Pseudomonadota bacterium]
MSSVPLRLVLPKRCPSRQVTALLSCRHRVVFAATAALAAVATCSAAERKYGPGVTDTEIKIGQTMPYSGPLSAYGAIGRAQLAYFAKLNADGGINGRKVRLISLDDGYNYAKTVEAVRRLVEQDGVLLLFGLVGKSTNLAIRRYANVNHVPHLFIASGASDWADAVHFPWTMGWAPTYTLKARLYATHILNNLPHARIGLLYANDDYAHEYVRGFKEALGTNATAMIIAEQTVEQTDAALDAQIHALRALGVDTLVSAMEGKRTSQALRKMAEIGWHATHYVAVASTVTKVILERAGVANTVGLISAHYAKDIDFAKYREDPDVRAYDAWAKSYYAGDPYDGLASYGYQAAQALEYVLRRCGEDLTRENVMRVATTMKDVELPLMLPGVRVSTSPTDYHPIKQLRMLRFDGDSWEVMRDVSAVGP